MSIAIIGSIESGMIFSLMALGVYITFRILKFPDLTVDGSFTSGGALAATMIASGSPPLLATFAAMILGCCAGSVTGLLHTKGKIDPLLAGILSMIALYSINLRIMGKANVGLLGEETLFSQLDMAFGHVPFVMDYGLVITIGIAVLLIKYTMDWFFNTEIGLALRATGDNEKMIRSFSANTDNSKIVGLSLSNGLVALSGALMAQYQGFADVSMGIGMIIIGLASVIIGEAIFGHRTIRRTTMAVIGGTIVYRIIVAFALRIGLDPSDMKLVTALIVIAALISPRIMATWKKKRKRSLYNPIVNEPGRGEQHVET